MDFSIVTFGGTVLQEKVISDGGGGSGEERWRKEMGEREMINDYYNITVQQHSHRVFFVLFDFFVILSRRSDTSDDLGGNYINCEIPHIPRLSSRNCVRSFLLFLHLSLFLSRSQSHLHNTSNFMSKETGFPTPFSAVH